MSDEALTGEKRPFLSKLTNLFQREPKNREDLVDVIRDSAENALIDSDTKEMMEGVMEIAELRVRDIMIPRGQIVSIDAEMPLESCLDVIIASAHSRFPVMRDGKESIEGMLLAKDLLPFLRENADEFKMETILRPMVVVPESKRVDRMLKEFRSERFHLAMVVDEFGAISGLITIEDILEQIVGDIDDEFDEAQGSPIRQLSRHTYSVSALTSIEDFNHEFGTGLNDSEADTLGGLMLQAFGRLPHKGESVVIDEMQFKITSADSRRIRQLRVTLTDEQLAQREALQQAEPVREVSEEN